jgi:hypothetical protein
VLPNRGVDAGRPLELRDLAGAELAHPPGLGLGLAAEERRAGELRVEALERDAARVVARAGEGGLDGRELPPVVEVEALDDDEEIDRDREPSPEEPVQLNSQVRVAVGSVAEPEARVADEIGVARSGRLDRELGAALEDLGAEARADPAGDPRDEDAADGASCSLAATV